MPPRPTKANQLKNLLASRPKDDDKPISFTALADKVLSEAFPAQRAFIEDKAKRKCCFVLRRGGKSQAMAIYLISTALANPVTKSLYMGLTRDSAENVLWMNIMEPILLQHNIPHKYISSRRLITFPNKSTIQLTGTDASDSQITKYLGGKYVLAMFDECQDVRHDLKHWIEDMLGPAMVDYGGTICLAGTAGRSIGRYWYHITQPQSVLTSYQIHKWSAEDNPHMAQLLIDEMERLRREQPGIELTEGFRNQYLCEWVLDNIDRVYHNQENNLLTDQATIDSLLRVDPKWSYMIGFDFGFEDATSYVVCAFSKYDNKMYVVETFKQSGLLLDELAYRLALLRARYKPVYIVGDCQNKTLVETLRHVHRIPAMPAYKLGKEAHIAAMNSDFQTNKILVIKEKNEDLINEWSSLIWDERMRVKGKFQEAATKDNHAADACLYVHHFSRHYAATDEPIPDPHPMMTAAENRLKRQMDMDNNTYVGDNTSIYDQIENNR